MLLQYINHIQSIFQAANSPLAAENKHFIDRADQNTNLPAIVHRQLNRTFEKGYGNRRIENINLFETIVYGANYAVVERNIVLLEVLDGYYGPMDDMHCIEASIRGYNFQQEKEQLFSGNLTVRVRFG